jgi:hypothetical protein
MGRSSGTLTTCLACCYGTRKANPDIIRTNVVHSDAPRIVLHSPRANASKEQSVLSRTTPCPRGTIQTISSFPLRLKGIVCCKWRTITQRAAHKRWRKQPVRDSDGAGGRIPAGARTTTTEESFPNCATNDDVLLQRPKASRLPLALPRRHGNSTRCSRCPCPDPCPFSFPAFSPRARSVKEIRGLSDLS